MKVHGHDLCSVNNVKNGCRGLRQATAFKISYHMVKITSQVQKIRSGCIFLNIARRASKSYRTGGLKNLTTKWKILKHDCNMVMKAKV